MSSKSNKSFKKFLEELKKFCLSKDECKYFFNYFKKNWVPYRDSINQHYCCGINSTNNICEFKFKVLTKLLFGKQHRLNCLVKKIVNILEKDYCNSKRSSFIPGYIPQMIENMKLSEKYQVKKFDDEKKYEKFLTNSSTDTKFVDLDDLDNNNIFLQENIDIDIDFDKIESDENEEEENVNEELIVEENNDGLDEENEEEDLKKTYLIKRNLRDGNDTKKYGAVYNVVDLQNLECTCKTYYIC